MWILFLQWYAMQSVYKVQFFGIVNIYMTSDQKLTIAYYDIYKQL